MKITVVGAGAIGGYLGARLARAGNEVSFIARNRNLQAINANGFKLILEAKNTRPQAPRCAPCSTVPTPANKTWCCSR